MPTTYVACRTPTEGPWLGDIAEILIYDHALSGGERHGLEEALLRKYALVADLPPSAPSANPNGGPFTGTVSVALSTTTPGATIRYTLDGSEPSLAQGTAYGGPFSLTSTTLVKGKAFLGSAPSQTAVFEFFESSEFSPTSVAGLQLWLRADSVNRNAGSVDVWPDQSGHGNDAVQTASMSLPTVVTDDVSGMPVLRFDGTNDIVTLRTRIANGQTVFLVLRNSNPANVYPSPLGDGSTITYRAGSQRQVWDGYDAAAVRDGATWLNGATILGTAATYPASTEPLVVLTSIATGPVGTTYIGCRAVTSDCWLGDIAEVLIYDRAVTEPQRLALQAYLARRYLDSDGDGLSNKEELQAGTDRYVVDTNGDGLSDYAAVRSGVDATRLDADGDGLLSAAELRLGTNPFQADTDGDGVLDGADCFPLDPARSACPIPDPGDVTPPVITLAEPTSAVLVSSTP